MNSILVLNGPNLNLLGQREPDVYGPETIDDIRLVCEERARQLEMMISFEQSNYEGALIDQIQGARNKHDGIIFNPGAYTHTSIALMDAILSVSLPVLEVHLTNIFRREEFRSKSFVSPVAHGVICGLGPYGYLAALDAMNQILSSSARNNRESG